MERELQELIRSYLIKSLDPSEQKAFEKALEEDPVLQEEVALLSNLQVVIKERERLSLKNRLQAVEQQKSQKKPLVVLLIAAFILVIALLSTVLFWEEELAPQELYTTYFDVYPNNLRPTAAGDISKETQPFSDYELGNYEDAANGFLVLMENGVQPDLQFYYTMSILNTGKSDDEAIMQLATLEDRDTKYLPQVLWYSSLLYLKKEDLENARIQLKKLLNHPALYKNREAEQLLEKLN